MDITEVLNRKKPQRRTVEILLDESLLADQARLVLQIKRAEARHEAMDDDDWRSPVVAWRTELAQLEQTIRESTVEFTFEALPRPAWNQLVEDFLGEGEELSEEFMIEVVARSLVEPAAGREDVERMFAEWSTTETDKLYLAAFAANRESRSVPFIEAGTGTIPSSGSSSTTAEKGA